jgi:hypothetical protein
MVTVTAATVPRPGDPVTDSDLGQEHLEIWKKATGGGTAIPFGSVVVLPPSTDVCTAAITGSTGRFGVVVRLDENFDSVTGRGSFNTDASNQVLVGTNGGRYYVTGTGAIIKNSEVQSATTGLIAQFGGTLTDTTRIAGIYEGHYGESLQAGGEPPTNATTGQANLILRTIGRFAK